MSKTLKVTVKLISIIKVDDEIAYPTLLTADITAQAVSEFRKTALYEIKDRASRLTESDLMLEELESDF